MQRPSKRRFDMKGPKNNLARNFPEPADNMERRKHRVQRGWGKLGMICRLVEEVRGWSWGDECFLFSFVSTFHLPVALICYKSSTYVHTHAHTRMLWLTTVLVPSQSTAASVGAHSLCHLA